MGLTYVVDDARLSCTLGVGPSRLKVLPSRKIRLRGSFRANISDSRPFVNTGSFGECNVTIPPKPCVPACGMWLGGKSDVHLEKLPALLSNATLICVSGGGIIRIHSCSPSAKADF